MYVQGPKKWLAKHIKEGGPSRIVKEQQEGTSPHHVRAIFSASVLRMRFSGFHLTSSDVTEDIRCRWHSPDGETYEVADGNRKT